MTSGSDGAGTGNWALEVEWLGRVDYAESLRLQEEALEARRSRARGDLLLLLEHPAVVTLGRSSDEQNLLIGRDEFRKLDIEVHEVARGGDVTYHAPGQLVGYLILDLAARGEKDLHRFLRRIEIALMSALRSLGLETMRIEGKTGVFMNRSRDARGLDRKIASIGIGVRRWISYHGFALNVTLDLSGFKTIVPCGLEGVEMTSVQNELDLSNGGLDRRTRWAVENAMTREFGKA